MMILCIFTWFFKTQKNINNKGNNEYFQKDGIKGRKFR